MSSSRRSGVFDKNGKEICEGNIVAYPQFDSKLFEKVRHVVVFVRGCFALRFADDKHIGYELLFCYLASPEELEIVETGDYFENRNIFDIRFKW